MGHPPEYAFSHNWTMLVEPALQRRFPTVHSPEHTQAPFEQTWPDPQDTVFQYQHPDAELCWQTSFLVESVA
jgi:hypothetical protein